MTMIRSISKTSTLIGIIVTVFCSGCGGGGGGGGSSAGRYLVQAGVASDTCGERISAAQQVFTLAGGLMNTSLVTVPLESIDGSRIGAFYESSGECVRDYIAEFHGSGGNVTLTSRTSCANSSCESTWQGTALELEESAAVAASAAVQRVRGEACNPNVPFEVGYRPSLFECNGNAAVLMRGALRNNYSVVVRRNGQFNDRDPLNPSCGTNRCSPYKTQKRIELPEYQVNCLGASGYSDYYVPVNRISIKFTAQVTNANDTSQFEQYCLTNVTADLN